MRLSRWLIIYLALQAAYVLGDRSWGGWRKYKGMSLAASVPDVYFNSCRSQFTYSTAAYEFSKFKVCSYYHGINVSFIEFVFSPLSGCLGHLQFPFLWITGYSWHLKSHLGNDLWEFPSPYRCLQSSRNHICRKPQALLTWKDNWSNVLVCSSLQTLLLSCGGLTHGEVSPSFPFSSSSVCPVRRCPAAFYSPHVSGRLKYRTEIQIRLSLMFLPGFSFFYSLTILSMYISWSFSIPTTS